MTDLSAVVAIRQRQGTVGEASRTVHLALRADGTPATALTTLCGALFAADQVDLVDAGVGMPCTFCVLHRMAIERPLPVMPVEPPRGIDGYLALGWPVIARGDQALLPLGHHATAVIVPVALARRVHNVLVARLRPAPTLAHPHAPDHWIMLAGELFGTPLPWPSDVRISTENLPLPPTVIPRGPVTWKHPPGAEPLQHYREIDLLGAIRTIRRPSGNWQ